MKRILLFISLVASTFYLCSTNYYRISSFPIDGADIRDTFLIAVEYAGNTYIWNGQEATGKNYVCLENYSSNVISGDYADNEVAIVHNKWHSYYKLFSVLCKGDGDRDSKGGYYLGGVKGNNGISFSSGQVDAEITFDETQGIQIATKSGSGIFRFNITPNDPHGFKFYQHPTNMLYPTLYVKGANSRYTQEVEYEDMSDNFTYAQAEYYDDRTYHNTTGVYDWDFRLVAEDKEQTYPEIYLMLTNESNKAIAGSYLSTIDNGKPWQVYCTNSSVKGSTYTFVSDAGNITSLYLKYCSLELTPVSKDARGVYTYLIDLKWIDQNNKHRRVYKQLPIIGVKTTHISDNTDDTFEEMFFSEQGDDVTDAIDEISCEQIGITVVGGRIESAEPVHIYTLAGIDVTSSNGNLPAGMYIVSNSRSAAKVIVR